MPRLGRPRAKGPSTSGLTTEQDILRAAAQLFCEVGYGSTSTYAIAQAAGISQATMYHYFPGKHAILLALLMDTVQPSVELATSLVTGAGADDPPQARLRRLCEYDVRLLVEGEHNLGSLYLLPELGDERFAPFHAERERLYAAYRDLVADVAGVDPGGADALASLVFGLVESVILRRRREGELAADTPEFIADAALRLVGAGRRD
ncbi:TetR/AcrR family transcriptional regulator [Nocardioides mangrovi]|uniref:TetR/AcrR family transcriptional regulator n=1 Tax=Nocardioides mangrovi TaxID=2874580 RepID=A0ABS7UFE6_9ACTN|nr:TetR/AcrR family transcriptional regulator [Nocardioides mangrovi]MBZ5739378.1 TetR/AcrR family transcriptional regulator [Nocardioides mangrovi]